jgi:phage terminase large subunit
LVTLNDKYKNLGSDSRYFIVTGGRGSSKSFSVTSFLLLLTYEQSHVILFTRYTLVSAHISIIPEFIEKIELMEMQSNFVITKDEIINTVTGSKIIFKGIKTSSGTQTANLKSLQGVTTWVLDVEKKSKTPIDNFNHAIDAIRYAVTYQLENPNRGSYAIY